MDERLDTAEIKIWKMFLRAHASLFRTLEIEMQSGHGISMKELDVLVQLSLAENQRMTHTRLSERLLLTGGGVTRLVDRMAKNGLVKRRASRKDRRTSNVVITEKGQELLEAATPDGIDGVEQHFTSHLRDEEIPTIRGFLARVLDEDVVEA